MEALLLLTTGNHANTHIPEIIGNARGFELTGNATDHAIVSNFFDIVTANHTFATGGSNDYEHWGPPRRLGDQLNDQTEESCTQYNILKVPALPATVCACVRVSLSAAECC